MQRKRVKPSTSAKTDAHRDCSPLEINLEGKNLTDEGLFEVARGLEDALTFQDGSVQTRLLGLNVSQNALSVKSLSELAPSLEAAAPHLEDLDISGNSVVVETDDDSRHWETFLRSFRRCTAVKKLNLAGSNLSGSKAFEVLARVYSEQYAFNIAAWEGSDFTGPIDERPVGEELVSSVSVLTIKDNHNGFPPSSPQTKPSFFPFEGYGLPRVRNLDLSNTNMTDHGALFLSYVIDRHRWFQTAVCQHGWGLPQNGVETSMIVSLPNEKMSTLGARLIALVEAVPAILQEERSPDTEHSPLSKYNITGKQDAR